MICDKCKKMMVLSAFSFGECKECEIDIVCPHIPCYHLCKACAEKLNRCEQCGYLLEVKKEN